jgi:hypothetical protein
MNGSYLDRQLVCGADMYGSDIDRQNVVLTCTVAI